MDDDRFSTLAAREANAEELHELIAAELQRHPGAELVQRLHSHDVPCALVNPIDRVHLDPQVRHNEIVVEHDRPWLGPVREPRPPAHFSTTPTTLGRHAPKHDEHTDEVLAEIGLDPEAIADLRARAPSGPAASPSSEWSVSRPPGCLVALHSRRSGVEEGALGVVRHRGRGCWGCERAP